MDNYAEIFAQSNKNYKKGKRIMKKLLKKKDGFTLVELIVVIAILAILAAVAIPAYSGYINKAKDAAILDDLIKCLN